MDKIKGNRPTTTKSSRKNKGKKTHNYKIKYGKNKGK